MEKITIESVRQRFDRVAKCYDEYALIAGDVASRLLSRLSAINFSPAHIVDLGCGSGIMTALLNQHYPDAKITGVDISTQMLKIFKQRFDFVAHASAASVLPFADKSIDLLVSNLMLPWVSDFTPVFAEVKRVLRDDGVFIFSSFGPDTFTELRQAWARVDDAAHVHIALDMHDVGDRLLHTGFKDPVMDVERVSLKYQCFESMLKELKGAGLSNLLSQRCKGLTGRNKFEQFQQCYQAEFGKSLSLELIFAYAEGGGEKERPSEQEYTFSIDELRKTLRHR